MIRLSERGQKLLLKLIDNPSWTLDQLAGEINNSKKTVSAELSDVERFLEEWPGEAELCRKSGEGVFLRITEDQRNRLLYDLLNAGSTKIDFSDSGGRIFYIMLRLLQAKEYLRVQDFCDELFVSKGTAEKDLAAAERLFEKTGILLHKVRNRGGQLEASEQQIRNCYAHLITRKRESLYENGWIPPFSDQEYYAAIGLPHIRTVFGCLLGMQQATNMDYASIRILAVHIAVAIRRIELGRVIEIAPPVRERYLCTESYDLAKQLGQRLEEALSVTLPEGELVYLAMHLEGRRRNPDELCESDSGVEKLPHLVDQMIRIMSERYCFDVSGDPEIKKGLLLHLIPAISRMRNGFSISNPCLEEIKSHYLTAFDVGIDCFQLLSETYQVTYNEDEIAYLSMHIQAMVERNRLGSMDYRVLVVCPYGMGTSQLIVSRLRAHFDCFSTLDVMSAVTAEQENLCESYDFIITTIPLKVEGIPVIVVNPLLPDSELTKISSAFSLVEAELKREKTEAMDVFQGKTILFLPSGITKEEALRQGCCKLEKLGYVSGGFYESVLHREDISSTAYGIWAIPHGDPTLVRHSSIMLCISRDGIAWGKNSVKLFFLLALNHERKKDFSLIFDNLYSITCDYHLLSEILTKDNPEQVIQALQAHGYSI